MAGIVRLAYRLLINDRPKFFALIVGITFAVFLMVQMLSMFAGILNRSSATVLNVGASIWVMDPSVRTVQNSIGMPDYVLDAVRSADGVRLAVPLYSGGALVKLANGTFQSVSVLGLDDTSLFGRPRLLEGRIEDIYGENGFVVVKDTEFGKLDKPSVGTEFQINDHRGVVVGLARVTSGGLFGTPTLYTTYSRALQYLPNPRFTISYVLVEPKSPADVARIKQQVQALGYLALTKDEFVDRISAYYKYRTGIGTNILIMTVMSFIVGLSVSGQTFYTFVLENLERFGALKAIGAKSRDLVLMILFQASFTALTGYGLGVGLCGLLITLAKLRLPGYASMITYWNLAIAFVMVVIIAGMSSYLGIRRVLRIEPFEIFKKLIVPTPAISASGIVKWFGEGEARTIAISDVTLEAYKGEMLYIVGPSGSGKTTLLSVVSGILRPNGGTVVVNGTDIWRLTSDQLAEFRLKHVGFVFQDYHLFPRLTTAENVAIPLILKRRSWDDALAEARTYLDVVGLTDRADLPPVKLSGGEQQRVAIARAMAARPDILIMDEPTASLDGDTGRTIVGFVKQHVLNDQRCILIVTHDDRIYDLATRIVKMEDGRLVEAKKAARVA